MKIGIYNANLHTMGGGEKHIGVVAEYLSKHHEVEFICSQKVDKELLSNKLNLDLSRVGVRAMELPHDDPKYSELSKEYDFFINCTYFSSLKSQCAKSAMLVWFPRIWDRRFPSWVKYISYKVLRSPFFHTIKKVLKKIGILANPQKADPITSFYKSQERFIESREYIKTYDLFIANSRYTQKWIKKELGVDSEILYPPIDVDEFAPAAKEDIILSVGRFFIHSHNKKQLEMIKIFKELYNKHSEAKEYKYYLCGGVDKDPMNIEYLEKCKKEAEGYPIYIYDNIAFDDLKNLYSKSKVFWHAAGLGEDPDRFPDRFEHFGMTTVEAMSAGAVPVVIARGGQVEIVEDGKNGFLWLSSSELITKTLNLIKNADLVKSLSKEAVLSSKKYSKANMYLQLKSIMQRLDITV